MACNKLKKLASLAFALWPVTFSNYSNAEDARNISIANYADVAFCSILGDVVGESRLYLTSNTGLQSARKEALTKALQTGASHVVWRAEKTGNSPIIAIGRAFNCSKTNEFVDPATQNLLNTEYARLLGEATQGKISYLNAFTQLDRLRIRLIPNDPYLSDYFIYLEDAAKKVDSKEMTYEDAEKFLDDRKKLISQIALQETQRKISSQVTKLLKEDQDLRLQLEQTYANNNTGNIALMGLGLGLMNLGNNYGQAAVRPPSQTVYSIPGSRPITCTTMNNGGYVSCF